MNSINFIRPLRKQSHDATGWFRITIAALIVIIACIAIIHIKTQQTLYALQHEKSLYAATQQEVTQLEQELHNAKKLKEELQKNQDLIQKSIDSNRTLLQILTTLYNHAQEMGITVKSLTIEPSSLELCIHAKSIAHMYSFVDTIEQTNNIKLAITSIKTVDRAIIAIIKRVT